jgi:hypothetical protein
MPTARFWRKWLRLGERWLRRRIKSVSSQPIVFRQPRLRVLLPNEATLVPCAAAKPALADLRRCAQALRTPEPSADTVPTLTRRNTSPSIRHRGSFLLALARRTHVTGQTPDPGIKHCMRVSGFTPHGFLNQIIAQHSTRLGGRRDNYCP